MRVIFRVIFLLFIVSCGQDYNSNYFDAQKFKSGIDRTTPAGERFYNAFNVIQEKCISCHLGYHNSYSKYLTDADWKAAGLVKASDFAGSSIIQLLKNYGGTMPLSASNLSSTEIETLRLWIENL